MTELRIIVKLTAILLNWEEFVKELRNAIFMSFIISITMVGVVKSQSIYTDFGESAVLVGGSIETGGNASTYSIAGAYSFMALCDIAISAGAFESHITNGEKGSAYGFGAAMHPLRISSNRDYSLAPTYSYSKLINNTAENSSAISYGVMFQIKRKQGWPKFLVIEFEVFNTEIRGKNYNSFLSQTLGIDICRVFRNNKILIINPSISIVDDVFVFGFGLGVAFTELM